MARITTEDCMENVDNIFDLVLIGARRARQLINGTDRPKVEADDKSTVIALREISQGLISEDILDQEETRVMFTGGHSTEGPDAVETPDQAEELRRMQEALLAERDAAEAEGTGEADGEDGGENEQPPAEAAEQEPDASESADNS